MGGVVGGDLEDVVTRGRRREVRFDHGATIAANIGRGFKELRKHRRHVGRVVVEVVVLDLSIVGLSIIWTSSESSESESRKALERRFDDIFDDLCVGGKVWDKGGDILYYYYNKGRYS